MSRETQDLETALNDRATSFDFAAYRARHSELLADAVKAPTAAARLTWPRTGASGQPSNGRGDWADFVTSALAGAAANIGGIEAALAGRPGSWEADGVRQLLISTVGHGEEHLLEHRTEPVVVDLYVDEILVDLGVWKGYDDAVHEIARRYEEAGLVSSYPVGQDVAEEAITDEQERRADELADLEDRLEQLRQQDWAAYGQNLKTAVETAARRRPDLRVPVVVNVDLDGFRPGKDRCSSWTWDIAEQLCTEAIDQTPLPGGGRPPLQRLSAVETDEYETLLVTDGAGCRRAATGSELGSFHYSHTRRDPMSERWTGCGTGEGTASCGSAWHVEPSAGRPGWTASFGRGDGRRGAPIASYGFNGQSVWATAVSRGCPRGRASAGTSGAPRSDRDRSGRNAGVRVGPGGRESAGPARPHGGGVRWRRAPRRGRGVRGGEQRALRRLRR